MFIWLRNIRRKRQMQMLRLAVVIVALLAAFAFTINIRSAQNSSLHSRLSRSSGKQIGQSSFNNLWSINMFSDSDSDSQSDATFTPLLTYHPFNNSCKFPLPNTYAIDIMDYTLSERLRQMKCPIKEKDYASMDSEGFMYVHPHFVDYPRLEHYVSCKVDIIEGGLRQPEKNMTKNMFIVEKTLDVSLVSTELKLSGIIVFLIDLRRETPPTYLWATTRTQRYLKRRRQNGDCGLMLSCRKSVEDTIWPAPFEPGF
uniref:Uncharacterized protein n=2 Tax=Caenorhabditis japonica TaxID=281687 RepID=A0A8R1ID54_CAEJA